MRNYLEKRLETLVSEHNNGQTALKNLEAQRVQVQETMLRITGAIQVVQEALKDGGLDDQPIAHRNAIHPGTATIHPNSHHPRQVWQRFS